QTYYWAVSAIDDSGGVTFSDTASFWTNAENEAPAEFELLLPTDAEVLTVLSPTFTWESSDDPDLYDGFGYHLILGNSPEDMDTLWSGEDTTITLEWELDDNMTYYWAVFAEDWSDVETYNVGGFQSFVINQGNDAPSMVELITPDSVLVLTLTPEMVWSPAMDADPGDVVSYEMHWWGDGIEFDSVLTDTNAVFVTSELEDNTQYFWEVIAMDQTDGISHSEEVTFWTDLVPEAPGAFALIAPEDDVAGLSDMPSFEWVPSVDPDPMDYATYTIQIASDSSFVDVVFDANTEVDVALDLTEALATDTEYWWRVVATDTDSLTTESETFKFTVGYVSIAETVALPTEFILDQNYPNPFNPSTTLRYGLPEDSEVSMIIYDIRGNTVRTIESGAQVAGWYEHIWNGMNDDGHPVSTGLYLTRLRAGSYTKTIKMLYLK
ncbi:MAG: T9SS type A sorting domain-containing protein, partial [Chloroflexi bacterium]|nr:T9SS type A sorting domain-containing protein [Chloroflexota bacterium]